jgi:prefoldin subunit 5
LNPADKYLIIQDERDGVITVSCTPTDQTNVKKEFQSQLQSVNGEIDILQIHKDELTAKIADLKLQKTELQSIIDGL